MTAKRTSAGALLTIFLGVLGLMLWGGSPSFAAEKDLTLDEIKAIPAGRARAVVSISTGKIVLAGSPANIIINLTGKKVTVINHDNNPSSFTAITPGSRIQVFQRASTVFIRLDVPTDETKKISQ